jgi:bifunctional enzyme CysN/CysC
VIADCPGHAQYTRNAITGASTADVAIVLIDARHGVVEQTRRHTLLMSLLRVPHFVVAVNKMDLVAFDEARFEAIRAEFAGLAAAVDAGEATFIPVSALAGDNVVDPSTAMPWYDGPTLLGHLETVDVEPGGDGLGARFPVQFVIRPHRTEHRDYRGYAGTVAAGVLRPGDDIVVLPSGTRSRIERIDTADGPVDEAGATMAVTLVLADDVDVSRGDMICGRDERPTVTQDLDATVAWMDAEAALVTRRPYLLKHTTRTVRAMVTEVHHRLDVDALRVDTSADSLVLNEVGRVRLRTTEPVFVDDYRHNRTTGSFVLIDETTHQTAAAGMIVLDAADTLGS